MDTIKINKGAVKMVAHRGASGLERENTVPAFLAAGNRSYFGVETDIHRTADGKYVVIHDETTSRVTRGAANINVEENPYDAVKDLVLPDKDGTTMRQDIRIPLLAEYIHICKKYGKVCVLELKNAFNKEEIREIVAIIREYDYLDKVIFISFVLTNCLTLRELLPQQPVQWLTSNGLTSELMKTLVEQRLGLDSYYKVLTQEVIDALHAEGLEVNCWTVDDPEWAEKLVAMGVDYITTNILE
jgi:glycerophosphoryl diester phosphodiesterase